MQQITKIFITNINKCASACAVIAGGWTDVVFEVLAGTSLFVHFGYANPKKWKTKKFVISGALDGEEAAFAVAIYAVHQIMSSTIVPTWQAGERMLLHWSNTSSHIDDTNHLFYQIKQSFVSVPQCLNWPKYRQINSNFTHILNSFII